MLNKLEIAKDWLPRYTGMPIDKFGENILLTNFSDYVENFSNRFDADIYGDKRPCNPNGVLFLGKCGGLKTSSEIGHFILPIAAIRGEGTSDNYYPSEVPALPSFKLHKFVSEKIIEKGYEYRTGVIHTTNRRVWEHDQPFLEHLKETTCIGIDMETATIFIVGHYNEISRGALLLVSDVPVEPDGVKTEESDKEVTQQWSEQHLELGINSMTEISKSGEQIQHFRY